MVNQLKFIKQVIYSLKRQYGGPIDIYETVIGSFDVTTGIRSNTTNQWHIERAIRMPRNIHRDPIWSALGNQVFQYSGVIQLADRVIIVDMKDLPTGFVLGHENWYVVIDAQHYSIVRHDYYDFRAALYIVLKQIVGSPPEQVINVNMNDDIQTNESQTEIVVP